VEVAGQMTLEAVSSLCISLRTWSLNKADLLDFWTMTNQHTHLFVCGGWGVVEKIHASHPSSSLRASQELWKQVEKCY
jgi:hypothetical protein